jgi:hypothetical protein
MLRCAAVAGLATAIVAAAGSTAAFAGTRTFGSTLTTAPTLDTANGAYQHNGKATGTEKVIPPFPHAAEDATVWNTHVSRSSAGAPVGGQVTGVKVEGCAIKDTTAPGAHGRQTSQGVPVNTILFQTLHRQGASVKATATAGNFLMPFCSHSKDPATGAVNTHTVTTFHPVHECVARGDLVGFHDIGGFIPATSSAGPWYPQGVPFDVIARVKGSATGSYVGVVGVYGPGSPSGPGFGFARESGQELTMQLVEGTGNDAYGLCPGGHASEPATSNTIICDYGGGGGGHPRCNAQGQPALRLRPFGRISSAF